MYRGAWQAIFHGVAQSQKRLKRLSTAHKRFPVVCVQSIHFFPQGNSFYFLEFVWFFEMVFRLFFSKWKKSLFIKENFMLLSSCSVMSASLSFYLPEFAQNHVHRVGDAIQPPHLLSFLSPPAFSLSQHQGLFKWVSPLHQVAKVLEFQLQHQSFQWTPRTHLL